MNTTTATATATNNTITTGTDVLRTALRNRLKRDHPGQLARDLNTGVAALDEFAHGRGKLPNEILDKLADILFAGAGFDPQRDLLTRKKVEAVPFGTALPEPAKRREVLLNLPGSPPIKLQSAVLASPVPAKRAGWAD